MDTGLIKLKITSDDSCTIILVCMDSLSIRQVIQEYIKIRKIRYAFDTTMSVDGIDVNDCVLARSVVDHGISPSISSSSSSIAAKTITQEYLVHDTSIINFINKTYKGSHEFTLFGFKAKHNMSSIHQLHDLSTQLSSISTMFHNTIDVINQFNQSSSSLIIPISNISSKTIDSNRGINNNTLIPKTASNASSIISYIVDRTDTYIADVSGKLLNYISEYQHNEVEKNQPQYKRLLKAKGITHISMLNWYMILVFVVMG